MLASSEMRPMIISQFLVALPTVTPWRCTASGRLVRASWSLFWTFDHAMSGSVPGENVSVMRELPDESLVEDR